MCYCVCLCVCVVNALCVSLVRDGSSTRRLLQFSLSLRVFVSPSATTQLSDLCVNFNGFTDRL